MWNRTAARILMQLTRLEREIITDSLLKIQSIEASLEQLHDVKLIDLHEIHNCLSTAHNSFRAALTGSS
jgi:hypothetical protein